VNSIRGSLSEIRHGRWHAWHPAARSIWQDIPTGSRGKERCLWKPGWPFPVRLMRAYRKRQT
jgi:hypothetical protein